MEIALTYNTGLQQKITFESIYYLQNHMIAGGTVFMFIRLDCEVEIGIEEGVTIENATFKWEQSPPAYSVVTPYCLIYHYFYYPQMEENPIS